MLEAVLLLPLVEYLQHFVKPELSLIQFSCPSALTLILYYGRICICIVAVVLLCRHLPMRIISECHIYSSSIKGFELMLTFLTNTSYPCSIPS